MLGRIRSYLERHTKLKHWLKIDHIAFLLIVPAIFINTNLALFFWAIAFIYDIYEQWSK